MGSSELAETTAIPGVRVLAIHMTSEDMHGLEGSVANRTDKLLCGCSEKVC